jgi:hypothetical protein
MSRVARSRKEHEAFHPQIEMPCAHSRGSARLLQWNAVPGGAAGRASGSTYFVVKRVPRLSCVNW